ncbi:hypothetical protein QNO09_21530 [Streptomyces sp. 378]|uniref:hypothetical protein n=1 Tax=Streptomyces sp. 378 TaxID=3049412 RepID=UPI0024C3D05E|nr:hypothetical protein [Streptomyces sp. 378]MDK1345833.1 hypothetical protein [Streptomyces sp. 378]
MREKLPAVALCAVALMGVSWPCAAAPPLPLPVAGAAPLVTEGVTIEGPLVQNVSLPMLK